MKSFKEYKANLTFQTDDPDYREASKIEMEFPADLTIGEFKNICIRMAHAIGYHEDSIERSLGRPHEPPITENEEFLKDLYKSIQTNNEE